jgi:hypothetical protein
MTESTDPRSVGRRYVTAVDTVRASLRRPRRVAAEEAEHPVEL